MNPNPEPQLAAILHADVTGSTRLIKEDHQLALALIQSTFARLAKSLEHHGGIVCEIRGDAVVARFPSASDAVAAACSFQADAQQGISIDTGQQPPQEQAPEQRMNVQLRIGISLGEVIQTDTALSGAGVVLAQRLEQLASPGGVVIQGSIAEMLTDLASVVLEPIGEQNLKGFEQPVMAFTAHRQVTSSTNVPADSFESGEKPGLPENPDAKPVGQPNRRILISVVATLLTAAAITATYTVTKTKTDPFIATPASLLSAGPSIAVLPFTRLGGDANDHYVTEGITEDLITDLSKLSGLLVISRDSSFAFNSSEKTIPQIANALGARYILDGNIRYSGKRLRINTQLIDTTTNTNVWAERYEFESDSIFESQDEITNDIIQALALQITPTEKRIINAKPTDNPAAYASFQKGQTLLHTSNMVASREYFQQAIELDPAFTRAYAALSISHAASTTQTLSRDNRADITSAFELATRAVSLDNNSAEANFALGTAYLFRAQHAESLTALHKSLELNPNSSDAHMMIGWNHIFLENYDTAITHLSNAIRLKPLGGGIVHAYLGAVYCLSGRLHEAESILATSLDSNPELVAPRVFQAITKFRLRKPDDAEWDRDEILLLYPEFTISNWPWVSLFANRQSEDLIGVMDDMREIGFPE